VPLETPLEVRREGAAARIFEAEQLVAEVAPVSLAELIAPAPVTLEQAVVGASRFPLADHPFPTCFVCGSRRERLDELRIHAYTVSGVDAVANPWVPSPSLADAAGNIPPRDPLGVTGLSNRLGRTRRFAVRIDHPVVADRVHIVVARSTGREGRKLWAVGGLYAADGTLCAASRAT
jgi:hypothetical protein